jgi:hypothetical protein
MAILKRLHFETGSQKLKMASPNRKYLYLSFYTRQQRNFNGYPHVFRGEELSGDLGYALS